MLPRTIQLSVKRRETPNSVPWTVCLPAGIGPSTGSVKTVLSLTVLKTAALVERRPWKKSHFMPSSMFEVFCGSVSGLFWLPAALESVKSVPGGVREIA